MGEKKKEVISFELIKCLEEQTEREKVKERKRETMCKGRRKTFI